MVRETSCQRKRLSCHNFSFLFFFYFQTFPISVLLLFIIGSERKLAKMYGLILENMSEYIRQVYGEDRWEEIRRQASVDQPSFSVHQVYPENLIPRLAKKAIQVGVVI